MIDPYLDLPDVIARTTLSASTIYRRIKDGSFPRQEKLSLNRVAWRESAVQAWQERNPSAPPT